MKAVRIGEDACISWIRRSRSKLKGWDKAEVPLAEPYEAYVVRVINDGKIVREQSVNASEWTYTKDMRSKDGTIGDAKPCLVAIAQVSDAYGLGPAATLEI